MSNSYMKSSYFQTQVNQANRIKECYPCGSNCTVISGGCNCTLPTNLTLSTLTVNGKTTINGLIDPTGMEFTPVLSNPGGIQANTIWVNGMDMNKLYFGNSAVTGGGGWVGTAATNLNMNNFSIVNTTAPGNINISSNGSTIITASSINLQTTGDVSMSAPNTLFQVRPAGQDGQVRIGTVGLAGDPTLMFMNENGTSARIYRAGGGDNYLTIENTSGSITAEAKGDVLMTSYDGAGNTSQVAVNTSDGLALTTTLNIGLTSDAGGHLNIGTNTIAGVGAEIIADDGIRLEALAASVGILAESSVTVTVSGAANAAFNNGENRLGVQTVYEDLNAGSIVMDVNKPEQIGSNNAYVSMTFYRSGTTLTVNNSTSLAFETHDFIWRYSGQFGSSGLTTESRFCSATNIQVDVNVVARDMNDTIVWWVELRSPSVDYRAIDFTDERYGYINDYKLNPATGEKNQTFSFSSVFDLTSAGSPPSDGDVCKFRLFGWGNISTSSPSANVSITVRPLRNSG